MVAVRADKELAAGTVVSIGFSVQFAGEEKGSKVSKLLFSILLSKQQSVSGCKEAQFFNFLLVLT